MILSIVSTLIINSPKPTSYISFTISFENLAVHQEIIRVFFILNGLTDLFVSFY